MVDQTKMSNGNGNGAVAAAPRAVAHNTAEFVADAVTLAELQIQLLRCDWRDFVARLVWPSVFFAAAAVLLASCVPIALVCIALLIHETATLSPAASFAITLGVALVLGGLVAFVCALSIRKGLGVWKRSQGELAENVRWMKQMIQRLGQVTKRGPSAPDGAPF
jgi:hypothetical protein